MDRLVRVQTLKFEEAAPACRTDGDSNLQGVLYLAVRTELMVMNLIT
jgi:hypothetical protein